MSDQPIILSKWFSYWEIILARGQLDHSYTFWTMANYEIWPSRKFWTSPSKLIYTHLLFVLSKITYFPIYYIVTSQFKLSWKGFVSTRTIIALGRLAKKMQIESSILWCAKKLSAFITHNKYWLVVILSFAKK